MGCLCLRGRNRVSAPPPPVNPVRHPPRYPPLFAASVSEPGRKSRGRLGGAPGSASGVLGKEALLRPPGRAFLPASASPHSPACEEVRKECWIRGQLLGIKGCFLFHLTVVPCVCCTSQATKAHADSLVWTMRTSVLDKQCPGSNPSSTTY